MPDIATLGVATELERYFAASRLRAEEYGHHYVALWEALEQASTGGKKIRPALVLAAYAGFGGSDEALATRAAVSFELLHTAFVIHDDVIDLDLARRGVVNIGGQFSARARAHGALDNQVTVWAAAAAILAGDLALSEAHRILALLPVEPAMREKLLDLLDRAVFVSAAGELSDVTNTASAVPLTVDQVIDTLEQKTAIYSFETPLQAGAVLAGASEESLRALGQYGRLVGVAFQLTDDMLGVFGDPAQTGKSILADLREGKQTALIAHAGTTSAWSAIAPFIGKTDLTEREAEFVKTQLRDCGAMETASALAIDHADRAIAALDTPLVPTELRATLTALAQRSVNRSF